MDVQTLIDRAGGVPGLMAHLGVARTTVLDWKRTNTIPGNRVVQIGAALGMNASDLLPLVARPKAREAA